MPNRNVVGDYRYGYQGEYAETDPETGKVAFELRLYDPRINRWLTTDPAGQFASPYMSMGNNWVSRVDPDGAYSPPTDFVNSKTKKTVHINDGINQVIEIDDSLWSNVLSFQGRFNGDYDGTNVIYNFLLNSGTPRPDLFYTINNVLEGQTFIAYGSFSGECFDFACKQERNNGGSPAGRYGQINLWVDNSLSLSGYAENTLTASFGLGISTITSNLSNGNSVVTGANYGTNLVGNRNQLTDHFINIVGQGHDVHGNYFSYWDNAGSTPTNTSLNRFYLNSANNTLIDNSTIFGALRVTEIRPNN